ncbi:MAG TPA: transcription termination/antitermination NusG family protein [Candidatus Methylomirabilis sp.]|nr:transcription termination/antitermination NusG family protein [Candidatus Methylomirabilis sp.]
MRGPDLGDQKWYVLWTQSHCEQLVHDQLAVKGFHLFLPTMAAWSRRQGTRRLIRLPMFPGYLFLRHAMDKTGYVEVCKARGLVRILGDRWDRLAAVPDQEIDAIQKVAHAHLPAQPHPFLREGQRVRVTSGPLAGVEGILLRINPTKGLLVISVALLRRSVAVQVDCTVVAAA